MSACPVCGCDAAKLSEEIKEQRADIRALAGWIRKPSPCPRCADKERDLAMAMAELRSVAQQRDTARQSLRAAEADAAETESVNSDLRTVNARLVADLADAMERLNHAESIIMQ